MAFKVEKINGVRGELELSGKKYNYTAYPFSSEVIKLAVKSQKEEDELASLEALDKYFEECIEFEKKGLKSPKKEVKKMLDRADRFYDFVKFAMDEVGKQTRSGQKD